MDNNEVYRWALRGLVMSRDSAWATYTAAVYSDMKIDTKIAFETLTDLITSVDEKMAELEAWRSKNCDL